MLQTMVPKSFRAMKFYFTTVYQEIWVGVAITAYAYYKISYGGKAMKCNCSRVHREEGLPHCGSS
uniref:68MP protein n=1 Tax=Apteryx owenii TaxID=8824 RepID=A0A8B9PBY0_APTOW